MVRPVKLLMGLAVLAVVALLWLASEEHYQGCVSAAEATTAPRTLEASIEGNPFDSLEENGGAERDQAVSDCSRLPF
jgi:hypothetical protein